MQYFFSSQNHDIDAYLGLSNLDTFEKVNNVKGGGEEGPDISDSALI